MGKNRKDKDKDERNSYVDERKVALFNFDEDDDDDCNPCNDNDKNDKDKDGKDKNKDGKDKNKDKDGKDKNKDGKNNGNNGKNKDKDDKDKNDDKCKDDDDKDHDHDDKDKDKDKDKKHHHPKPPPPKHHKTCVKEVLKAIHEAQLKVKRDSEFKKQDPLGHSKKPKKNTIPFIIFAEDSEPFKGTGVTTFSDTKHEKFKCVTSYVFRIKDLEGKCAVLELLTFKSKKCSNENCKKCSKKDDSVCGQIHCENVDDLIKTGIHINVDLSCFCAVTTLPAVRL